MTTWIEINLPWYCSDSDALSDLVARSRTIRDQLADEWRTTHPNERIPPVPDLSIERIKTLEAKIPTLRWNEFLKQHPEMSASDWHEWVIVDIESLPTPKTPDEVAFVRDALVLAHHRRSYLERVVWENNHPLSKTWAAEHAELVKTLDNTMFSKHSLCAPGVQIELADGRILLIGDVDKNGGGCGCCAEIAASDVIVRARDLRALLKDSV